MRIAVTTEGTQIFGHFGKTKVFTIFEVQNGTIVSINKVDTSDSGHELLAVVLENQGVDVLLCGGIGGGARQALAQVGIKIVPGLEGDITENVQKYIRGEQIGNPNYVCHHHDYEHEEGHSCHCHED